MSPYRTRGKQAPKKEQSRTEQKNHAKQKNYCLQTMTYSFSLILLLSLANSLKTILIFFPHKLKQIWLVQPMNHDFCFETIASIVTLLITNLKINVKSLIWKKFSNDIDNKISRSSYIEIASNWSSYWEGKV